MNTGGFSGRWQVALYAVPNLPLIQAGDDLGDLICEKASADGFATWRSACSGSVDSEPSEPGVELVHQHGPVPQHLGLLSHLLQQVVTRLAVDIDR